MIGELSEDLIMTGDEIDVENLFSDDGGEEETQVTPPAPKEKEEKEIEKVIYQIGSTYYANYRDECMEKMPELAAQIKSLQDEIATNKEMIEKLSTEEICPQCGKKVNPGSKFCILVCSPSRGQ